MGNSLPSHSKHLTAALGEEELEIEPSRSPETQGEAPKPHLSMLEVKCRYRLLLCFVACTKAPGNVLGSMDRVSRFPLLFFKSSGTQAAVSSLQLRVSKCSVVRVREEEPCSEFKPLASSLLCFSSV